MNEDLIEQTRKKLLNTCGTNIGIYIDFDNVYYGLKNFALNVEEEDYNIIKLLLRFYEPDKIRTIRAYADFDQVKVSLTNLQKDRVQIRQVYGNGQIEKNRKNSSDIELSIDAMESSCKDILDTYVFVTADSDMIPIMSRMIFKNKKVHLFYIGSNISQYQDITKYAHVSEDLIKILDININMENPSYWKDTILSHIEKWYSDYRNKNKLYGGKWLREGIQSEFFMSYKLASNIIEFLEKNGEIIKHRKNTLEGYVLPSYLGIKDDKKES